jgi:hypothetical protein
MYSHFHLRDLPRVLTCLDSKVSPCYGMFVRKQRRSHVTSLPEVGLKLYFFALSRLSKPQGSISIQREQKFYRGVQVWMSHVNNTLGSQWTSFLIQFVISTYVLVCTYIVLFTGKIISESVVQGTVLLLGVVQSFSGLFKLFGQVSDVSRISQMYVAKKLSSNQQSTRRSRNLNLIFWKSCHPIYFRIGNFYVFSYYVLGLTLELIFTYTASIVFILK